MHKIKIVAVGKLSPIWRELFYHYSKKISYFAKMEVIEVKAVNNQTKGIQIIKETKAILAQLKKKENVVLCAIGPSKMSSVEFADIIGGDDITFVIGGSHGVDESQFPNKISFSKMTFARELFRILLVEQIFRSFSIKNGSKYHK